MGVSVSAQDYSRKDFVKTSWFSDNLDSAFYLCDTIKLIKYSNPGPDWDAEGFSEYEMKYFNHVDYVSFELSSRKRIDFLRIERNFQGFYYYLIDGWFFDKKQQTLVIKEGEKEVFRIKILSERKIKVPSKYAQGPEMVSTIELTCVKISID